MFFLRTQDLFQFAISNIYRISPAQWVSFPSLLVQFKRWTLVVVAKIDAVQAEYPAFETVHETNGLIETAKELGVAFVAFSHLGHGFLVDNFTLKSLDDFVEDDFRRTGLFPKPQKQTSLLILTLVPKF